MPKITFIQSDGTSQTVEGTIGQSVMEVATNHLVRGIVGECGGGCSCATCHLYVDETWLSRLPPPDEMETGMLEAAVEPQANSRLSCQIKITPELDGLITTIPAGQV